MELRELPGIGRYTAGAIASIAFGEAVPVVDGNVSRVLARLFAIRNDIRAPSTHEQFWSLTTILVSPRRAGDFNQAMMELGAMICLPRNPRCDACPLESVCKARKQHLQHRLPIRHRDRPVQVTRLAALVRYNGKLLLTQRQSKGRLAGFWEMPSVENTSTRALQRKLEHDFGLRVNVLRPLGQRKYSITKFAVTLKVFETTPRRVGRIDSKSKWAGKADLCRLALPAPDRRVLEAIL